MVETACQIQQQLTDKVIMVRPSNFGFNAQTAPSNPFQKSPAKCGLRADQVQSRALHEFDVMAETLHRGGIDVMTLPDRIDPPTPDAIFPNNWFSLHQPNTLVLYPMLTPNRRSERQVDNLLELLAERDISPTKIVNLAGFERHGSFLEGTGSMVLDRANRTAFAMQSQRTSQELFDKFCEQMDFTGVFFHSVDDKNFPVYHTNVVMSVGEGFGVSCLDSVNDPGERQAISEAFETGGNQLIPITLDQLSSFCGNILELKSTAGEPKIVLSHTAYTAFGTRGRRQLERFGTLLQVNIPTIEKIGGGSARCMIAEVFS